MQSWIAGLDLKRDTVIEIACIITDGRLRDPVEVTLSLVLCFRSSVVISTINMLTKSGLLLHVGAKHCNTSFGSSVEQHEPMVYRTSCCQWADTASS